MDIDMRIAKLLRDSRDASGLSQDAVSKKLGVSKKTIQNWESGDSCPNLKTVMLWFEAIDVPVYPYMLKLTHPELEALNANSSDDDVRSALIALISDMDMHQMRKQFFEMFGEHGTAPDGMGEVKTAYLHLPMDVKIGIAEIICTQFEICQAQKRLVKPDHVMPDIVSLRNYINKAKTAVINGKETYL